MGRTIKNYLFIFASCCFFQAGALAVSFGAEPADRGYEAEVQDRDQTKTPIPITTPTPKLTNTPAPLSGANLYQSNCESCHGILTTSPKRGATSARIQSAILNNVGGMGSLSGLSSAAIDAIATALK